MQVPAVASKLFFISCALRLALTIFSEEGSSFFVLGGAEGLDYIHNQEHQLQKGDRTVSFETGYFRCAGSDFDHTF